MDQNADDVVNAPNVENNWVTIPEIILAKITNDVPLVIPFSVIQSAIKRIIIAPTDIVNAAKSTVVHEVVSITPPIRELMKNTIPTDWTKANGRVIYLIYLCNCCCPCSPNSWSSSKWGITTVSNWVTIEALINGHRPTATIEKDSKDHQNNIKKFASHDAAIPPVWAISKSIFTNGTGTTTSNL